MPFFVGISQVIVSVDDKPLDSADYRVTADGIVLNFPAVKGSIVTIKRVTPLSDTTVTLVVEELQNELVNREGDLMLLRDELQKSISAGDNVNDEFATALFRRTKDILRSNAQEFNDTIDSVTGRLDARITSLSAAAGTRWSSLARSINEQTETIAELDESLKSQISADTASLAAGIEGISCHTDVLQGEIDELKKRLKSLEILQSKARSAPLMSAPVVASADISRLSELLEQTRSALNFETQVRRREDAQIKALLKRLLGKFESLEDFIAGGGDIPDTVISELRRESRLQDDKLGRTALQLIALAEELKEKHN